MMGRPEESSWMVYDIRNVAGSVGQLGACGYSKKGRNSLKSPYAISRIHRKCSVSSNGAGDSGSTDFVPAWQPRMVARSWHADAGKAEHGWLCRRGGSKVDSTRDQLPPKTHRVPLLRTWWILLRGLHAHVQPRHPLGRMVVENRRPPACTCRHHLWRFKLVSQCQTERRSQQTTLRDHRHPARRHLLNTFGDELLATIRVTIPAPRAQWPYSQSSQRGKGSH